MRISDWSSDVCSSDLLRSRVAHRMDAAESRSLVRHAVDLDETGADFHAGRHRPASYQNVAKNGGAVLLDDRRAVDANAGADTSERQIGAPGIDRPADGWTGGDPEFAAAVGRSLRLGGRFKDERQYKRRSHVALLHAQLFRSLFLFPSIARERSRSSRSETRNCRTAAAADSPKMGLPRPRMPDGMASGVRLL